MKTIFCPNCKKLKHKTDFSKNKNRKNGLQIWCKKCVANYYQENKKILSKKHKEYNKKNKEKISTQKKRWRENPKNKRRLKKLRITWLKNPKNKERIKLSKKKYRDKNRVKIRKINKKYRSKKSNKRKKYIKIKNRLKTDTKFRLLTNLRRRIHKALKLNQKSLSTMMLIGCEIDYLMYHIQEQFKDGMTWDNYGLWHIDHIKPCAKFDLSKPSEQRKCFNYTNLQPLWAEENLKKGNR